MTVVVFNEPAFLQRYPEFTATAALYQDVDILQQCFNEATVFLDNRDCSLVPVPPRDTLLNMLTAHICALYFGIGGQPPSRAVGTIGSAGEGSVNVSLKTMPLNDQNAWYMQTMYGASYWRASASYRTGFYVPPDPPPVHVFTGGV